MGPRRALDYHSAKLDCSLGRGGEVIGREWGLCEQARGVLRGVIIRE